MGKLVISLNSLKEQNPEVSPQNQLHIRLLCKILSYSPTENELTISTVNQRQHELKDVEIVKIHLQDTVINNSKDELYVGNVLSIDCLFDGDLKNLQVLNISAVNDAAGCLNDFKNLEILQEIGNLKNI
ncbi:hypothetical protein PACTADRAFT_32758 [Pachysolen tannophilus NRRL Y-2460]|uniref:Uncharacterized protein n=1 Tax=Pachysolen tannophilus NRRL Y-2460 TaxID=669874 RepID=A0A1E4TZV6_PACTA|nr:hypothetical protein PACTADRAFT_32758 [Pachysolen tannophilus NRRL Y-2460]